MKGGLRLKSHLDNDDELEILNFTSVPFVTIPVNTINSKIVVEKGNTVIEGQLIAEAVGTLGVNVHASICGVVTKLVEVENNTYVCIEANNKKDVVSLTKLNNPSSLQIVERVKEAGIVGLSGSGFPTHIKLVPNENIDTVIINGCECESYLSCDNAVMQNYAKEIVAGALLLVKAVGATQCIFAINKKFSKAYTSIAKEVSEKKGNIPLYVNAVASIYPIGSEKILVKQLLKIEIQENALPKDYGVVVNNVQTALAVYNAVKLGKPCYERVITVAGKSIKNAGNYWVKNGTMVNDIIENCGGFIHTEEEIFSFKNEAEAEFQAILVIKNKLDIAKNENKKLEIRKLEKQLLAQKLKYKIFIKKDLNNYYKKYMLCVGKIVLGGLFMGKSIQNLNTPINKCTSGVLFLSHSEVQVPVITNCINCGKCTDVCPMRIDPRKIYENYIKHNITACKRLKVSNCFECGCCSFVCPAKIQLAENFAILKKSIKEGRDN